MLTNEDLQSIQKIVKETVKNEVKKEITNGLSVGLKPIKKDIRKLREDLNVISKVFDRELIDTIHRVGRIEGHLHLPPIQVN